MRRWLTLWIGAGFLLATLVWAGTGKGPLTLAWDAVTLDTQGSAITVAYYNIRWGTTSGQHFSGQSTGNVTQFTVKGLDPSQLYYFVVTAVDTNGRESANSNEVTGRPTLMIHR